jgi:hypothetical protein
VARKRESGVLTWMRQMGKRLGAIALIALFMRAVLPAGYMLAEADTGGARYVTLQICDGHASAQKLLNLDTGEEVLLSALPKKVKDVSSALGPRSSSPWLLSSRSSLLSRPALFSRRRRVFVPVAVLPRRRRRPPGLLH